MSKRQTLSMIQGIVKDHNSIRVIKSKQAQLKHLQRAGEHRQLRALLRRPKQGQPAQTPNLDDPYVIMDTSQK